MVLPDGARTKRIPALSWDSVIDTESQPDAADDRATDDVPAAGAGSITLAPLRLDLTEPAATPATPVAPVETFPTPVPDEPPTVRTTPPAVIVPAIGDVTSGPDQIAAPATPATPAVPPAPAPATDLAVPEVAVPAAPVTALPEIQEATPVEATPVESARLETVAPLLPSVPASVPRPETATSFEFDSASVVSAPSQQSRRPKKRRGIKLLLTIVVLGGLVAAGLVFGQAYLFPGEWDDTSAPYAEAVETASGVEFAETLAVVAEPTADFATRMQVQFAPLSPEEIAQWRALGLASGTVDDATIAQQLSGWQDAVYSTLDGQIYHDLGVAGPELDAQITQEMAAASLDQQFRWSADQNERTLDAAAATSAEVLRQSRAVQQASSFADPVPSVPSETADVLPAVIGYRMLAPHVFAEFDSGLVVATDRTNPLEGLGTGGPGILGDGTSTTATDPAMLAGDVVAAAPVAKDRAFWYLVFAGYLDARTAYDASEAVVENSLTAVIRGATQCVSATFSGGGVEQTTIVRSALTAWTGAAPGEMASSVQVLPDGALQLVSCDPGAEFGATARPGVVHELLSWRAAELATLEAARVGGGGEAELVAAWDFAQNSQVAFDVMNVPASATPAELAGAAHDAVADLFAFLG
ncbi:MAG TPA: hypothetical protein VMY16_05895 [Ilumatobacteraceae bacterium]|nr:hypothetical protein [Ilumatobacteraceae bacterium]